MKHRSPGTRGKKLPPQPSKTKRAGRRLARLSIESPNQKDTRPEAYHAERTISLVPGRLREMELFHAGPRQSPTHLALQAIPLALQAIAKSALPCPWLSAHREWFGARESEVLCTIVRRAFRLPRHTELSDYSTLQLLEISRKK